MQGRKEMLEKKLTEIIRQQKIGLSANKVRIRVPSENKAL